MFAQIPDKYFQKLNVIFHDLTNRQTDNCLFVCCDVDNNGDLLRDEKHLLCLCVFAPITQWTNVPTTAASATNKLFSFFEEKNFLILISFKFLPINEKAEELIS